MQLLNDTRLFIIVVVIIISEFIQIRNETRVYKMKKILKIEATKVILG